MLFCSQSFLLFFVCVFAVYWALPWRRARVWLLLGASFYFYARWKLCLALLVCGSATADYLIALGLESLSSPRRRKLLLAVSVVVNLGVLCFYKYTNFFLHSLEEALRAAGAEASFPLLKLTLPIGISFYTFEAISYTTDVYRRRIRAERDLSHFLVFILFFPHLIAGPVVRGRDFLPQIGRPKRWSWVRAQAGVQLFLLGMLKKWVVADHMAHFVDPVFKDPGAFRQGAAWLAVVAYALQIYCDFSGYTDMALGCAHLLGYKLAKNFHMPYLSANVSEFWRRWHISLSTWLRDYLFIPLGGSRGGPWQTARNLLITMTLGGLWHGPNWTFLAWGLLHGLLLVGHRTFQALCRPRPLVRWLLESVPGTVVRVLCTLVCVMLGWVLFRAQTFADAATVLSHLLWPCPGRVEPMPAIGVALAVAVVGIAHFLGEGQRWRKLADRLPAPLLGGAYASMLGLALLLAPHDGKVFVYFQF